MDEIDAIVGRAVLSAVPPVVAPPATPRSAE